MRSILLRSVYEALVAPLLYTLALAFALASFCWPLLLMLSIGSDSCSKATTIILLVTQGMWWLMSFCLALQFIVLRDSHRVDLSAASDYASIDRPD